MDLKRALILTAIAVVTYLMILAWQKDYGHPASANVTQEQPATLVPGDVPDAELSARTDSDVPAAVENSDSLTPAVEADIDEQATTGSDRIVRIRTDVLALEIDRLGGDIVRAALLNYPRSLDDNAQPFVLLERTSARQYVAQSGLVGANGTDTAEGRPLWNVSARSFRLGDNDFELDVDLTLTQPGGVEIIKRFTLERGSYLVRQSHIVRNNSNAPWRGALYGQIKRDGTDDPGRESAGFAPLPTYLGAAYWSAEKAYNKLKFSDMEDSRKALSLKETGGWVAMIQHYFLSAWVPDNTRTNTFTSVHRKVAGTDEYLLRFVSPLTTVEPGQEGVLYAEFYAGPKEQDVLAGISPGLDMTVDYGPLWFISQPIFALLVFLQSGHISVFGSQFDLGFGVGNWGVAIILLTLILKLLFYKLSAASYRSMARMRKVAPEMQRIREQHKDDRQKASMEMMKLYQTEKINPLGGCLPMLVQMPVFISLYYVLLESVELRQAPFFLWIHDLSVMDPWFVLPLLMGASMWFQMRLNPTPPDPTQAQVMKWMPVIFTVFFLWFPAGLVLYWLTNNLLSIAQQWFITRKIERE
ncbi:membrane protein insertase YidC [Isoalcanivorax beigongshangi]|uniref:Membrane protein insertase YidC n=1 Tax=Isoalcanivorax beigongshangi TaxID=3238810 RepID=A0ABV4ACR5_9GAMM